MNRQLLIIIASLSFMLFSGCFEAQVPTMESAPAAKNDSTSTFEWGLEQDLITDVAHSFYTDRFAYFGPGLPGWRSVSGAGRHGVWSEGVLLSNGRAVDEAQRVGSWINGRAGSLRFPYPENTEDTAIVQFWFFGIVSGQAVSVFLNGTILQTLDLSVGWGLYAINLPPLPAGEHRLRFWFRKTTHRKGIRTPGAIGQLRLGDGVNNTPWPTWHVDENMRALPSEDGSAWTYYLTAVAGAEIQAVLVTNDSPVKAELSVVSDTGERTVLRSVRVEAGSEHTLSVQLPVNFEGAQRLTLKTTAHRGTVHWRSLVLRRRQTTQRLELASYTPKRIVVVLLDDATERDIRLTRKGAYPLTPTLDWLAQSAHVLPFVFTGGDDLGQRTRRVLNWSLKLTMRSQKPFRNALFSEVKLRLDAAHREQMDRDVMRSPDAFTQMLEELELWIKLGGTQPYTVTIVLSGQPKVPLSSTAIAMVENLKGVSTPHERHTDAQRITHLDQKLGRLFGLLSYINELDDTLVMLMGHKPLTDHSLDAIKPGDLFSPLLLWHKGPDSARMHASMISLSDVLNGLEQSMRNLVPHDGQMDLFGSVSQLAQPLTSILSGHSLLILQDAKRYGLFKFGDGWTALKQSKPITQRAMRVLVDQHEISAP